MYILDTVSIVNFWLMSTFLMLDMQMSSGFVFRVQLKYNFKLKYNYVFYLKTMIASQKKKKKVHPPTQYLYGEIIKVTAE